MNPMIICLRLLYRSVVYFNPRTKVLQDTCLKNYGKLPGINLHSVWQSIWLFCLVSILNYLCVFICWFIYHLFFIWLQLLICNGNFIRKWKKSVMKRDAQSGGGGLPILQASVRFWPEKIIPRKRLVKFFIDGWIF